MGFKVGDRVRIITKKYEGNSVGTHYGLTGTIKNRYSNWQWNIIRDDRIGMGESMATILYDEDDLEVIPQFSLVPEMELEEIEQAQQVFQDLQKTGTV